MVGGNPNRDDAQQVVEPSLDLVHAHDVVDHDRFPATRCVEHQPATAHQHELHHVVDLFVQLKALRRIPRRVAHVSLVVQDFAVVHFKVVEARVDDDEDADREQERTDERVELVVHADVDAPDRVHERLGDPELEHREDRDHDEQQDRDRLDASEIEAEDQQVEEEDAEEPETELAIRGLDLDQLSFEVSGHD